MIIDLSWSPWQVAEDLASEAGIPLVRTLLGSQQLVKALDSYLESRNATDAALILESESGKFWEMNKGIIGEVAYCLKLQFVVLLSGV